MEDHASLPRRRLATECLVIFGGLPLLALSLPEDWWPWLLALAGAGCIAGWLLRTRSVGRCWMRRLQPGELALLPLIASRFVVCTLLIAVAVWLFAPEWLLRLPSEHAAVWIVLLASYPLFSVLPQEFLYRYLFRLRYRKLFAGRWVLPSALAFAWLHVAFLNPLAPLLTLVAGWFFAQTYHASRSLRLAVAEHTLYGAMVFTVGLDRFFLHSSLA